MGESETAVGVWLGGVSGSCVTGDALGEVVVRAVTGEVLGDVVGVALVGDGDGLLGMYGKVGGVGGG